MRVTPLAEASGSSSPFWDAVRSMVRTSPSLDSRSSSVVVANRLRSNKMRSSTSSSSDGRVSTVVSIAAKSGRSKSGRMSTSAVNSTSSPSSSLVISISG